MSKGAGTTLFMIDPCGSVRVPQLLGWQKLQKHGVLTISSFGAMPPRDFQTMIACRSVEQIFVITHGAFPAMNCCLGFTAFHDRTNTYHEWVKVHLNAADPYGQVLDSCREIIKLVNPLKTSVFGLVLDQVKMRLAPVFFLSGGVEARVPYEKWLLHKASHFTNGIPGILNEFWPDSLRELMLLTARLNRSLRYSNASSCESLRIRRIVITTEPFPPEAVNGVWPAWGLNGPDLVAADQYNLLTWDGGSVDLLMQLDLLLSHRKEDTDIVIIATSKELADDVERFLNDSTEYMKFQSDQLKQGGLTKFIVEKE